MHWRGAGCPLSCPWRRSCLGAQMGISCGLHSSFPVLQVTPLALEAERKGTRERSAGAGQWSRSGEIQTCCSPAPGSGRKVEGGRAGPGSGCHLDSAPARSTGGSSSCGAERDPGGGLFHTHCLSPELPALLVQNPVFQHSSFLNPWGLLPHQPYALWTNDPVSE